MSVWFILFLACIFALIMEYFFVKEKSPNISLHRESNKSQKTLNLIIILLLAAIAGFRNVGGTDFNVYRKIYNSAPELEEFFANYSILDEKYSTFGVERGYLFLNSFFKTIHISYYGFICIHSFFMLLVMYFALRQYTSEFIIVIFVFLYKFYFYNVFISLRQPITIALFFIMLKYIQKKDWKKYFLLCFVCFFFHTASIVLFPLYFLNRLKLSKKLLIWANVIFFPMLILSLLNVPVMFIFEPILELDIFQSDQIFDKANSLITGESLTSISMLHTLEYYILTFLLIYFYDDIKECPNAEIMIKLFLCLLPVFTLFRNYEILTRIKDYFTISYGFIISYLCMIKNGKFRQIGYLATVVWCGFGFFRFIILFDGGAMMNYIPNFMLGRSFFQ